MADRPEFTAVFEEDENTILERIKGRVGAAWKLEDGDYMYDAIATVPPEVKDMQINRDYILKNSFPQYAEGEYMDLVLEASGVDPRKAATPNKRNLTVVAYLGVRIPKGQVFSSVVLDGAGNPLEYTADEEVIYDLVEEKTVPITCTTAGIIGNITPSEFILMPSIPGVRTITDGGTTIPGEDMETEAEAWERYKLKVQNPDTGGNKYDYARWVIDIDGVGGCLVIMRWNGRGTVKVVIIDTEYEPATQVLVDTVQEIIDPLTAWGQGEGKAPGGAEVTIVSAVAKVITVAADSVTYSVGADPTAVKAAFTASLEAYRRSIALQIDPNTSNMYPVAYNKVIGLLITTPGVENFTGLTVNGGTVDVAIATGEVPTLGVIL